VSHLEKDKTFCISKYILQQEIQKKTNAFVRSTYARPNCKSQDIVCRAASRYRRRIDSFAPTKMMTLADRFQISEKQRKLTDLSDQTHVESFNDDHDDLP
jgi:hypothetical protein